MKRQVLLIEDDDAMRASLAQTMELEGIIVIVANGLAQARRSIRANFSGGILADIRMPQDDGFSVLEYVKSVDADLPLIIDSTVVDGASSRTSESILSIAKGVLVFVNSPATPVTMTASIFKTSS